jgi:transposase-like protein
MHNLAMRLEREQFLDAAAYERSDNRRGYANGLRSKKIDTVAGTMSVEIPKTRGTEEPFYPQTLPVAHRRRMRTSNNIERAV